MSDMKRTKGCPADYAFKEMTLWSEIFDEEPWTRAQEAAAINEMRQKKESRSSPKAGKKEDAAVAAATAKEDKNNNTNNGGEKNSTEEETKASPKRQQVPVDEDPTLVTTSVKCNNNSFSDWVGFTEAIDSCLSEPGEAEFLDLSFNALTTVDEQIGKYTGLTTLYLHGNQIKNLKDLRNLRALTDLRKLTLHGNPVENVKNYRMTIIAALPKLKQLDFTPITSNDRDLAEKVANRKQRQRAIRMEKEGF
jgi:Leucine-rich repeat (LRR) protein|tara:strand:- start:1755 stop:2504 length:750 start_codon:yes stop_codon:yes gene_type:complete